MQLESYRGANQSRANCWPTVWSGQLSLQPSVGWK